MENLASIIGKNLSSLRKAKGLTQLELSAQIHYSDKSISKWELGYTSPSIDILMDFAAFYDVTVDYLVKEHDENSAKEVIASSEAPSNNINKFITLAMTIMFVLLVCISIFLSEFYFQNSRETSIYAPFIWCVPVSLFLAALETGKFFHNRPAVIILLSCFLWTLLLSFCIHFAYFAVEKEQIWFILTVGIPLQVILILMGGWKKKPSKKENGKTSNKADAIEEKSDSLK